MDTLATLFLHSARMYSALADAVFADSVEQSQFASSVSSRRMETAKAIIGTPLDIDIELDDEDMEILTAESGWQSCLVLDNLILRVMKEDERKFFPLLNGVYIAARKGVVYASSQGKDRPKHKMCLACGAVTEEWECPVCGNGENWLKGIEVPENSEEPEAVDATEDVSLPNLSFGDFAPEVPSLPKRWEVIFDSQEDDIFKATGLARPQLG